MNLVTQVSPERSWLSKKSHPISKWKLGIMYWGFHAKLHLPEIRGRAILSLNDQSGPGQRERKAPRSHSFNRSIPSKLKFYWQHSSMKISVDFLRVQIESLRLHIDVVEDRFNIAPSTTNVKVDSSAKMFQSGSSVLQGCSLPDRDVACRTVIIKWDRAGPCSACLAPSLADP